MYDAIREYHSPLREANLIFAPDKTFFSENLNFSAMLYLKIVFLQSHHGLMIQKSEIT